jgi:hypothetical protein
VREGCEAVNASAEHLHTILGLTVAAFDSIKLLPSLVDKDDFFPEIPKPSVRYAGIPVNLCNRCFWLPTLAVQLLKPLKNYFITQARLLAS